MMNLPNPIPPTPFYHYDLGLLERTLDTLVDATSARPDFVIHYAVKANSNPEIMKCIAAHGLGADTVSLGEMKAASAAGFPVAKTVLAGVGKTDAEIEAALDMGILALNVESIEELDVIAEIAARKGVVAPVSLRINPDIDAHTHHYITTGLKENKFGIDKRLIQEAVDRVVYNNHLMLRGLHFHIGSQITTMEPYALLCRRALDIVDAIEQRGIQVPEVNLGGGLGIDYDNPEAHPIADFKGFFGTFSELLPRVEGRRYHFEPGRAIVAQCGSLVTKVLFVKKGFERQFAIVDAGMTELIRPALYGAMHAIRNISAPDDTPIEKYDIVGPVCESSDTFATDYPLPLTRRGDILIIMSSGAYGEAMSSHYNSRKLNPPVYSK